MKLEIGDLAPEFELYSDSGQTVKLSDLRGQRVLLFFYPKADTPGCTIQACGFRDNYDTISESRGNGVWYQPRFRYRSRTLACARRISV